jgi:hypothetical protein
MGIVIAEITNVKNLKNLQIELIYEEEKKVLFVRNTKRKKKDKGDKISFPFATNALVAIIENKTIIKSDSIYIAVTDLSVSPKYATYKHSFASDCVYYLCTNNKSLWANEKKPIPIHLTKIK